MKQFIQILSFIFLLTACNSFSDRKMEIPPDSISKLQEFKKKPKFEEDYNRLFYLGLQYVVLKPVVTELINKVADDFIEVAENKQPTEAMFQDKIKIGLARFTPLILKLDTEDQERVCSYFEEIMDIVGLQSSNGQLNKWRYGFDPK